VTPEAMSRAVTTSLSLANPSKQSGTILEKAIGPLSAGELKLKTTNPNDKPFCHIYLLQGTRRPKNVCSRHDNRHKCCYFQRTLEISLHKHAIEAPSEPETKTFWYNIFLGTDTLMAILSRWEDC